MHFPGVSQMIRSTPGVLFPLFSVTRFTAIALPLNEWVSSRCKAFTLPQRRSRTAFAIRTCSRRTDCRTFSQSIWSQSAASWEAAPVILMTAICFSSCEGSACSLATRDPSEVCPLSGGMMLVARNPCPGHYSPAFAFSDILYPHPRQRSLRSACPLPGGNTGLPCST